MKKDKVIEQLELLQQYYIFTRQVGHTSILKEGLGDDVIVLTDSPKTFKTQFKDEMNCKLKNVTRGNLDKLRGQHSPLAIDNFVMMNIIKDVLNVIPKDKSKYKDILDIILNYIDNSEIELPWTTDDEDRLICHLGKYEFYFNENNLLQKIDDTEICSSYKPDNFDFDKFLNRLTNHNKKFNKPIPPEVGTFVDEEEPNEYKDGN